MAPVTYFFSKVTANQLKTLGSSSGVLLQTIHLRLAVNTSLDVAVIFEKSNAGTVRSILLPQILSKSF